MRSGTTSVSKCGPKTARPGLGPRLPDTSVLRPCAFLGSMLSWVSRYRASARRRRRDVIGRATPRIAPRPGTTLVWPGRTPIATSPHPNPPAVRELLLIQEDAPGEAAQDRAAILTDAHRFQ